MKICTTCNKDLKSAIKSNTNKNGDFFIVCNFCGQVYFATTDTLGITTFEKTKTSINISAYKDNIHSSINNIFDLDLELEDEDEDEDDMECDNLCACSECYDEYCDYCPYDKDKEEEEEEEEDLDTDGDNKYKELTSEDRYAINKAFKLIKDFTGENIKFDTLADQYLSFKDILNKKKINLNALDLNLNSKSSKTTSESLKDKYEQNNKELEEDKENEKFSLSSARYIVENNNSFGTNIILIKTKEDLKRYISETSEKDILCISELKEINKVTKYEI